MTNEERIKNMTTDELSEFLAELDAGSDYKVAPFCLDRNCLASCKDCVKAWLAENNFWSKSNEETSND